MHIKYRVITCGSPLELVATHTEEFMRKIIMGAVIAVAMILSGTLNASAAPASGGQPLGVTGAESMATPVKIKKSAKCQDLRKACMYKRELGERGEGNCRRYRKHCRQDD